MLNLILAVIAVCAMIYFIVEQEDIMAFIMMLVFVFNGAIAVVVLTENADPYYQERSELNTLIERCELRLTREQRCKLVAVPVEEVEK